MDIEKLETVIALISQFEESSLGRAFIMLVEDAEKGRRNWDPSVPKIDRLLRPNETSEYLGYSWRQIKDRIFPRFDIQSSNGKTGKDARYLLSEVLKVQRLLVAEGDRKTTAQKG